MSHSLSSWPSGFIKCSKPVFRRCLVYAFLFQFRPLLFKLFEHFLGHFSIWVQSMVIFLFKQFYIPVFMINCVEVIHTFTSTVFLVGFILCHFLHFLSRRISLVVFVIQIFLQFVYFLRCFWFRTISSHFNLIYM